MPNSLSIDEFVKKSTPVSQGTVGEGQPLSIEQFSKLKSGSPSEKKPKRGVAEKVTDFLGFGKTVDTIGSGIAKLMVPKDQRQYVPTPTGKEIAGAALNVGSTLLPVGGVAKLGAQALGKTALSRVAPSLVKPAANIGTGALTGAGIDIGQDLEQDRPLGLGLGTAIGAAIPAIPLVGRGLSKLAPKPENIMNRVARLTPTQAKDFERLAGESHGNYLQRTGNFGTPEKIIENEATKFTNSLNEVDTALSGLSGNFKNKTVTTALDDLIAREGRIGIPNAETARLNALAAKNTRSGLTMSEINEVKRLYERNVKLDFARQNLPEGLARATRLDNELRAWQFSQAEKLGLKNLRELNKQTQLSKFIVDKLGKQLSGKTGNEAVNLTDWIVLSGGDPTAVSAFLVKKLASSKGFQAGLAKFLSKKPSALPIKAQMGGKQDLPSLIPGRDYGTTIQMRGPKPPTSIEPPAQRINQIDSLPNRLMLPSGGKSQGVPLRLPQSIRETNLGLDEVRNLTRSTPKQLPPLRKEVKTALPKTIQPLKGKGNSAIPKELEPLAAEARKYGSAEEFVKAKQPFKGISIADESGATSLYHETDQETAMRLVRASQDKRGLAVATDETFALGQGGKGAVVEFEADVFTGKQIRKPGDEFVGKTEYRIEQGGMDPRTTVKSITFKDEATEANAKYNGIPASKLLKQQGFIREVLEDKRVRYTNPNARTKQLTSLYNRVMGKKGKAALAGIAGVTPVATMSGKEAPTKKLPSGTSLRELPKDWQPLIKEAYDKHPRLKKYKGLLEAILMQESSMGTIDSSYNPKIGESAWLVGATDALKKELARNGVEVDLNSQKGVIDAMAAYLDLKRTVLNPGSKNSVEYKDPVNLYVQRYKTSSGHKLTPGQLARFREYVNYYANS